MSAPDSSAKAPGPRETRPDKHAESYIVRDRRGQAPEAPAAPEGDELARLRGDLQQAKDQSLRMMADVENIKKRLQREKDEFSRYAAETLIRELLPILDSLDQALVAVDPSTPPHPVAGCGVARDSAPQETGSKAEVPAGLRKQADTQAVLVGLRLIRQQLLKLLEREGVQRIPAVGQSFDPHRHEAVGQVETNDGKTDGTVVEEVQVGYIMHGKVLRPAMVKVAKKTADSV